MTATTDGSTGAVGPHAAAASEPSDTTPVTNDIGEAARRATARSVEHLLGRQDAQGWWKGDLQTNVTMDAEDLLLRQFLGVQDARTTEAAGRFIRGEQRADGTWATFHGGPGELSTTIEGYVALRLAGDRPDDPHMARAAAWIREHGGIAESRVFTRIWLALFGWWKWDDLPEVPPELIFLPKWFPLNIYSFGCWARQTIVPLTIVSALRPVRPAPFALDELHADVSRPNPAKPLAAATSWDGIFQRIDKALHLYHKVAPRVVRRTAMNAAARWIVERQENDGCWGGIQPPAVYSVIALHLLGYDLRHPVMRAGLESLDRFAVWREDGSRMIEACQSPVWDTCLATIALADAGLSPDHPALVKAAGWMLDEQIVRPGDWAVRRPGLAPGGWAFEFHNDNYPDIDDTAEVILALRRVSHPDTERLDTAVERGARWTLGMQSRNGAWGAFDADNVSPFPNRLPFCDFGEVIDPPSADVTAHVVEMLAYEGLAHHPDTRRGIEWLLTEQEADGSWFGRWGVNYVYGTGSAVPALVAAGIPAGHPAIRRAVGWLESVQNDDGGWGEDLRSYREEKWIGHGLSTASQTAWALLALLAAGRRGTPAVERGVAWLAAAQREDGSWDEPYFTGTGFPWDFSINYHLYRQVFPLTALGRYVNGEPRLDRTPARAERPADGRTRSVKERRPDTRAADGRADSRKGGLMDSPADGAGGPAVTSLLIACALGIEQVALRSALRKTRAGRSDRSGRTPDAGPVTVLRTGMGPRNAERATARALGTDRNRDAAVIASGFCAGLAPGMNPGDLIVADETRGPHGSTPCTGTALLVEALSRALPGRTVHTGPLTGSDHVVRGPERAGLRATGALAVDMESAATLLSALSAGARPVAAVRVVVDAPEHELVRIGTVRGGISAFRVLRAVIPAFLEWHRSLLLPRR